MGADFIMTGSINQCTVEAETSGFVKEMLSETGICDTAYAPSETLFEFGTKVQVLKKGTLFPVRANKLFQIYQQYESLSEIDEKTKIQLENVYFNKTFDEIYESIIEKQPNLAQKLSAIKNIRCCYYLSGICREDVCLLWKGRKNKR